MQGLDLSATAPTFLTYLSVALKNTNANFTKVTVRLTLSAKAISNAAIRIVNWHLISQVILDIGRNSIVATMVRQSGKNICWFVNNYFTLFCLEQQSLSCHESSLDDVEECEQADSPCMTKQIGKIFYQQAIAISVQNLCKIAFICMT